MVYRKRRTLWIWVVVLILSAAVAIMLTPALKMIYPLKYEKQIEECAKQYNLDKYLIMGIISSESGFDTEARSHKDAYGLMQLKEETALWCVENLDTGVAKEDINKPESNIKIGCAYMRYLMDSFNGDMVVAIAAYNAGPGNVENWLNDPRYSNGDGDLRKIPFGETASYVSKVQKRAKIYKKIYS